MKYPSTGSALANINDNWIYTIGGFGILENNQPEPDYFKVCFKYSIKDDKWSTIPSLNIERAGPSLCIMNDHMIFAYGGSSNNMGNEPIEMLDVLDECNGWKLINIPNTMKGYLCDSLFAPLSNTEIIIMGGIDDIPETPEKTWVYSIMNNTFETREPNVKLNSEQIDLLDRGMRYFTERVGDPDSPTGIKINVIRESDLKKFTLREIKLY